MTEQRSFIRKIVYFVLIGILLIPLSWLSRPATSAKGSGGKLSQMRQAHRLGEANLGEIDPTSETLKLLTLGMRGVAVNVLWAKAHHYKKVEDWDGLTATLKQITLLQPHFVTVWRHQSWNLAFNVAAEFDDYRVRYFYAKEGIKFLMDGTVYNDREPRMLWDVGWITNQKIGRSDERVQFRRMFADDSDFHEVIAKHGISFDDANGPNNKPDNWLVGRQWYLGAERLVEVLRAERLVDPSIDVGIGKMARLLFYEESAKCMINYAEAIETDGTFGEVARRAWKKAQNAWEGYGAREMPGRFGTKRTHHLGEYEVRVERLDELREQLDLLQPGLLKKLQDEKLAELDEDWQTAYRMAPEQRNPQQHDLAERARFSLGQISYKMVAERIEGDHHERALELAAEARAEAITISDIQHSYTTVPYPTWLRRCVFEQSADVLEGRERLYEAYQQYLRARLDSDDKDDLGAKQQFELGFAAWGRAYEEFPALYLERPISEDLVMVVKIYQKKVLDRDQLPEDFPLLKVVEAYPLEGVDLPSKPEDKPNDAKQPTPATDSADEAKTTAP